MLIKTIPKFIIPTGNAPIKKPYNENKLDPIILIHLSFLIELINKEIRTIREAKYPNHSSHSISIFFQNPFLFLDCNGCSFPGLKLNRKYINISLAFLLFGLLVTLFLNYLKTKNPQEHIPGIFKFYTGTASRWKKLFIA